MGTKSAHLLHVCIFHCPAAQALERNYWPSYNIPYFTEIYNRSGYPDFRAKLQARQATLQDTSPVHRAYANAANSLSYQLAPRAKISRRDQGTVSDLGSLKAYMRSNSFRSEPFSGGSAFGAICGRGDVDPAKPRASGCNDAKVRRTAGSSLLQLKPSNAASNGDC